MQAQCFICPECNYDHNHLGVGGINCLKRQLESKDERIKELEKLIEILQGIVEQAVDLPKGVEPHEWSDYKRSKES